MELKQGWLIRQKGTENIFWADAHMTGFLLGVENAIIYNHRSVAVVAAERLNYQAQDNYVEVVECRHGIELVVPKKTGITKPQYVFVVVFLVLAAILLFTALR